MVGRSGSRKRTRFRWGWCYVLSNGEEMHIGADQVAGYQALIVKRRLAGLPYGSIWKRRISYGPWRAAK